MIKATIIADSKNIVGNRITSVLVTIPRIILAELNTHRAFSRNSASSRAIPFAKMVESVRTNPFIPIAWQKDHKGMQGTEYFEGWKVRLIERAWLLGRDLAVRAALILNRLGVTKQICNRLLEPFMWHTVLITATEWENFFHQRCPKYSWQGKGEFRSWKDMVKSHFNDGASRDWVDGIEDTPIIERLQNNTSAAEIHIQVVAEAIWDAMNKSIPKMLLPGEWHIPYEEFIVLPPTIPIEEGLTLEQGVIRRKVKVSTAQCARTSYTKIGDSLEIDINKDIKLHDDLVSPEYGHWSPTEHCAMSMDKEWLEKNPRSGNFIGFAQYRKTFEGENKI